RWTLGGPHHNSEVRERTMAPAFAGVTSGGEERACHAVARGPRVTCNGGGGPTAAPLPHVTPAQAGAHGALPHHREDGMPGPRLSPQCHPRASGGPWRSPGATATKAGRENWASRVRRRRGPRPPAAPGAA